MSIAYYEDIKSAPLQRNNALFFLVAVNAIFAVTVLFGWTLVSILIVEPFSWATWMPVSRGSNLEDVIRYPFAMLWVMPLLGITGTWFAVKGRQRALAYLFVLIPIVFLSIVFGWYYLAPVEWH